MPDPLKNSSSTSPLAGAAEDLREDLPTLIALVQRMNHAQDAQLEATGFLRDEIGSLQGLLAHLIQILTPEQREDEGESLRDLLSRVISHQRELARLAKENLTISGRIETHVNSAPTSPKTSAVS